MAWHTLVLPLQIIMIERLNSAKSQWQKVIAGNSQCVIEMQLYVYNCIQRLRM